MKNRASEAPWVESQAASKALAKVRTKVRTKALAKSRANGAAKPFRLEPAELEILAAFEKGALPSVATPREIARLRAAARATSAKDRRLNIRLSSIDLEAIRARALEEGIPYQTLIASVLHKYVSGRLAER